MRKLASRDEQERDEWKAEKCSVVKECEGIKTCILHGSFDRGEVGCREHIVEKDETVAETGKGDIVDSGDEGADGHNDDGLDDRS